jgi:hypothetical protein
VSAELNYDFLYILGGGASGQPDHADPLGSRGALMDDVIAAGTGGPYGDSDLLAAFTGSIQTSQSISIPGTTVVGAGSGDPNTVSYSITIDADHRALYFVFKSENEISSLDGLWPWGTGVVLDGVSTSDSGAVYTDETPTGGSDPYGGSIIKGTHTAPASSPRAYRLVSASSGSWLRGTRTSPTIPVRRRRRSRPISSSRAGTRTPTSRSTSNSTRSWAARSRFRRARPR